MFDHELPFAQFNHNLQTITHVFLSEHYDRVASLVQNIVGECQGNGFWLWFNCVNENIGDGNLTEFMK